MPGNIFEDNLFKRQGGFSATPVLNDIVNFASQHSARTKTPLSTEALQALSEGAIGGLAEKQSQDAYRQGALSLQQQQIQNQQDQFNKELQLRTRQQRINEKQFESDRRRELLTGLAGFATLGGIQLSRTPTAGRLFKAVKKWIF